MIKHEYHGRLLDSLPDECFDLPFEGRSGTLPAVVLAAVDTVPSAEGEPWFLASTFCGGHRCDVFCAAVLSVPVRPDIKNTIGAIADGEFTDEYLGYFNLLPSTDRQAILNDYCVYLESAGLSCSHDNLAYFCQDLYPLDAAEENLKRLSADAGFAVRACQADDRVIFIAGPCG